jgi:hypothetical protein
MQMESKLTNLKMRPMHELVAVAASEIEVRVDERHLQSGLRHHLQSGR